MKNQDSETTTQCSEPGLLRLTVSEEILREAASETIPTPEPDFQKIQSLCAGGPIRFNGRPTPEEIASFEDEQDLTDAIESLKEPGSVDLDEFKKQLGI